jgi:hypothetical protein
MINGWDTPSGHSFIYCDTVRTGTMTTLMGAVQDAATKLAKRLPGVNVHVWSRDSGSMEWCSTHRGFRCEGREGDVCSHAYCQATTVEVTATGLPVFDGTWTVAGVLRVDSENVVTAHTVGQATDGFATAFAGLAGLCEHCHTARRRNLTVLLIDADGNVRPVGRSCLAEYTGGSIRVEILADLLGVGERFALAFGVAAQADPDSAPVEDIVACALILVADHGFVRVDDGGFGRVMPTAVLLRDCICPGKTAGEVIPAELTEAQRQAARDAITVISTADDGSEYLANLRAVVANEWTQVTGRGQKLGLLASLPTAVERIARKTQEAAQVDAGAWIGALDEKVTLTGTVTAVSSFEGSYGMSWIVKVATEAGAVKMFTTAQKLRELETGASVTIAGTVRSHDEFRGVRETLLGRPKLIG